MFKINTNSILKLCCLQFSVLFDLLRIYLIFNVLTSLSLYKLSKYKCTVSCVFPKEIIVDVTILLWAGPKKHSEIQASKHSRSVQACTVPATVAVKWPQLVSRQVCLGLGAEPNCRLLLVSFHLQRSPCMEIAHHAAAVNIRVSADRTYIYYMYLYNLYLFFFCVVMFKIKSQYYIIRIYNIQII